MLNWRNDCNKYYKALAETLKNPDASSMERRNAAVRLAIHVDSGNDIFDLNIKGVPAVLALEAFNRLNANDPEKKFAILLIHDLNYMSQLIRTIADDKTELIVKAMGKTVWDAKPDFD